MQDFSEGKETDWTVQLTTHLQLVLRSKMHGHLPPDPIYTSMAWCSVKATNGGAK